MVATSNPEDRLMSTTGPGGEEGPLTSVFRKLTLQGIPQITP